MGKSKYLVLALTLIMVLTGCAPTYSNMPIDPGITINPPPTKPTETQDEETAYWPGALDIDFVSGKRCTFEICEHIRIKTSKTCSSITLFGATTKDSGKVIDYFEQNLKGLKKGKARVVEFGTDPANSYENFVQLEDALCWK